MLKYLVTIFHVYFDVHVHAQSHMNSTDLAGVHEK